MMAILDEAHKRFLPSREDIASAHLDAVVAKLLDPRQHIKLELLVSCNAHVGAGDAN